jgi:hypothetical protein
MSRCFPTLLPEVGGTIPSLKYCFNFYFKPRTKDKVQRVNDTNSIMEVDGHSVGTFSHSGFSQSLEQNTISGQIICILLV